MRYCLHCGQFLPDKYRHCDACGSAFPQISATDQKSAQLSCLRKTLLAERRAWDIGTRVAIIFFCILSVCAVPIFCVIPGNTSHADIVTFVAALISAVLHLIVMYILVTPVVAGHIMQAHLEQISTQPERAVRYCRSVFPVALCLLFNHVALVFYLINFVRCIRFRAVLAPRPKVLCEL